MRFITGSRNDTEKLSIAIKGSYGDEDDDDGGGGGGGSC